MRSKPTFSTRTSATEDDDSLMMSDELVGQFDPSSLETDRDPVIFAWLPWKFECDLVSYTIVCEDDGTYPVHDVRLKPRTVGVGAWERMICVKPEKIELAISERTIEIHPKELIKVTFKPTLIRVKFHR